MLAYYAIEAVSIICAALIGAGVYHLGAHRPIGVTKNLRELRFAVNRLDTRVEALLNDGSSRH